MDSKPEVIRQQMEETRSALTQKLETLEDKVVSTVQDATSAVTDTVDNVKDAVQETVTSVKDSVQDTVDSVRDTFDVERQVQRRPWLMFGGSVALGFVAGCLLHRETARRRSGPAARFDRLSGSPAPAMNGNYNASTAAQPISQSEPADEPSLLATLTEQFKPEIAKLKGMAIGTALGAVRDLVTHAVPEQMKDQVTEMVNNVTVKLGGQPIQGQVLDTQALFTKDDCGTGCDTGRDAMGRPRATAFR
jgi:ElaB/YqjD/DUF883 family membrane-anchored ribosome-binding protein